MEKILVVAAHPDDEILGCGGYLSLQSRAGHAIRVIIMAEGVTSRTNENQADSTNALKQLYESAIKANAIVGVKDVHFERLPDNRMDGLVLLDVVQKLETHIKTFRPTTVLTHFSNDLNVDHRICYQAVVTACRPLPGASTRRILSFEVPSSTEWQPHTSGPAWVPNTWVNISGDLSKKLAALKEYESEMREWPHARSIRAVEHLARWRGSNIGVEAAEAFQLVRQID